MTATHPTRTRYLAAFKATARRFELDPDASTCAAEDYHLVLDGDLPITRFVAVSIGDNSIVSVDPAGHSLDVATTRALANVNDDLYAESPIAIVDLDNGNTYRPVWASMRWTLDYDQIDVPQRPTGVFDLRTAIEFLQTAVRPATPNRFSDGKDFETYALAWLLKNTPASAGWSTDNTRHAIALVSNESDALAPFQFEQNERAFYLAADVLLNSFI